MKRFAITINEILGRTLIVNANSLEDAISKVEDAYERGEIVLDYDDSTDFCVEPSASFENGEVKDTDDVSYYTHFN